MRKRLLLFAGAAGIAAIDLLVVYAADAGLDPDPIAWGEETRSIKIGIRVHKADGPHADLFILTTVMTNCGERLIKVAGGDTWNGPVCPEYWFDDDKASQDWTIAPPHLLGTPTTHVPLPIFIELAARETKVVHRSTFVPPVPPGEWKVYGRLRPSMDLRSEDKHKKLKRDGVWMNTPLVSGPVAVTIEKGESQLPQRDAPADADRPRR